MHILAYILFISVPLEALNLYKSNTTLSSSTEFGGISKTDSGVDGIRNSVLNKKDALSSKLSNLESLKKDEVPSIKKYGRLRKLHDIDLERDKNRTRKLKEAVNATTPYSLKKKIDGASVPLEKANDSSNFRGNLSLQIFKQRNRPQRVMKTSKTENTIASTKTVASTPSEFTKHPTRRKTTRNVIHKKPSEARSRNRPQRHRHGRKHLKNRRRHKTKLSSRHKATKTMPAQANANSKTRGKGRKRSFQNFDRVTKTSKSDTEERVLGRDDSVTSGDCPTCKSNHLSEEHVRQLRLKMFINTMAEKLRVSPDKLMERQKKRASPPFPTHLLEETLQDNAIQGRSEGFYAKEQEVILSGEDLGRNCIAKATSGCYNFDLAGKIKGDVASAQLWLYKTPDRNDSSVQTFFLYGLERLRSGRVLAQNQIQRQDSHVREGWVVINVTRTVTSWVQERKSAEMIAIRCATCVTRNHKALYGAKHGFKPLIVIKYDSTSIQSRDKRSYDNCDPRYKCCKRRLEINFRDIHMHTVEAPPDLSVGYCFGFCNAINHYTYNHTMIKQKVRYVDGDTSHLMREELKPCCVPIVLKSAMLIMRSENAGAITIMPNVIVEQCGCI